MKNLLLSEIVEKAKSLKITLSYKDENNTRKRYTKDELIALIEATQVDTVSSSPVDESSIEVVDLGDTMVKTISILKSLIKVEANKEKTYAMVIQHIQNKISEAMAKKKKSQVSQWSKALNIVSFMQKAQMKGGVA